MTLPTTSSVVYSGCGVGQSHERVDVYLSLGSNIDKEKNIASALRVLRGYFPQMHSSTIYLTEAVGFEGDDFYNLVVVVSTRLSLPSMQRLVRLIEYAHGRRRDSKKYNSRTLDIDILLYGNFVGECAGLVLPRKEIEVYRFVLEPLAEIAPDVVYPLAGECFCKMWLRMRGVI